MSPKKTELGLIMSVPEFCEDIDVQRLDEATQSIRVQMNALGGEIYLATFSVTAAKGMLIALATWPPLRAFAQELGRTMPTDAGQKPLD